MGMRVKSAVSTPRALPQALVALLALCVVALVVTVGARPQANAVDGALITMGLVALVAVLGLASRPDALVPRDRLGIAWAAFLGWALLCALVSGRVWASLVGEVTSLLGLFTLVGLTLAAAAAARFGDDARRALELVAPVAVFVQIAATVAQLALGARPRGTLPNSTYLGEAIVILLPFVLAEDPGGLRLERRHRLWLAGAAVITLAAAGSRTAALAATGWFLWALVSRSGLSRALKLAAITLTVVTVALGAFTFARGEVLGTAGIETLGERPRMWRTAALAAAGRPLVGYGPDGFTAGGVAVTTPERARDGGALIFRPGSVDPHNLAVWVLVSTGVFGLGLFAWALVELVLRWRRAFRDGRDVAPGVFAVVGAVAVFLTAPAALQVLPLFGYVVGVSLRRGEERSGTGVPRTVGWVLIGAGALVALAMAGNAATRLALEDHGADVSPAKVGLAQAATVWWPFDAHLAHLASLHWGWTAVADPTVAMRQPDLVAIERAVELDSRDPFVSLEHARTLRFYGAPDEAVEGAFLETLRRWELFPIARAEYATFLARAGRTDEARAQLDVATLVEDPHPRFAATLQTARDELARRP